MFTISFDIRCNGISSLIYERVFLSSRKLRNVSAKREIKCLDLQLFVKCSYRNFRYGRTLDFAWFQKMVNLLENVSAMNLFFITIITATRSLRCGTFLRNSSWWTLSIWRVGSKVNVFFGRGTDIEARSVDQL
jgi:hypothetical protein